MTPSGRPKACHVHMLAARKSCFHTVRCVGIVQLPSSCGQLDVLNGMRSGCDLHCDLTAIGILRLPSRARAACASANHMAGWLASFAPASWAPLNNNRRRRTYNAASCAQRHSICYQDICINTQRQADQRWAPQSKTFSGSPTQSLMPRGGAKYSLSTGPLSASFTASITVQPGRCAVQP